MKHHLSERQVAMKCFQMVIAFACLYASFLNESAAAKSPNVLLIVADDLGYSDLGCYGGEIQTPSLDSLAESGVRLTRFYNIGRCCPSRASILTGHYPHHVGIGHKVADLGRPGYRGFLKPGIKTIAEVLQQRDYRSFISGKWHLGTPDPTNHGFEEFYGTLVSAQTFWDPEHYLRLPEGRKVLTRDREKFYGTDSLTDHALEFLKMARQTPDRPWFLYLAYNAPHFPLHARQEDIEKYSQTYQVGWDEIRKRRLVKMKQLGIVDSATELTPRSRFWNYGETVTGVNPAWKSLTEERQRDLSQRMAIYAAMVDRMDQNIGRVIDDVKESNEFENTLVIFLSDNGACGEWDPYGFDIQSSNNNILHRGDQLAEMGGEGTYHSVGSAWANASNTPWRLQKHFNHEGGINSPCIVHWPAGNLPRGRIQHQPAHIIDLMPTISAAAGHDVIDELDLPGVDFIPYLGQKRTTNRTLFYEHEGNRAVHHEHWKLVALREESWELYDMNTDRTELKNLAHQYPEIVQELSAMWDEWAEENDVTPLPRDYGVKYLRQVDPDE